MSREHETDRRVNSANRQFVEGHAQIAAPRPGPGAFFYGIADADIDQGTSGTISVWYYKVSATAGWEDTGKNITGVRHFFLNLGLTIPLGTALRVEWYMTTWVISNWYCDIADWT